LVPAADIPDFKPWPGGLYQPLVDLGNPGDPKVFEACRPEEFSLVVIDDDSGLDMIEQVAAQMYEEG
jgi:hypothetical protein